MREQHKEKRDFRRLSNAETAEVLASFGEKSFRAKQIQHWLWKKSVGSFGAMNNLPKTLLDKLEAEYCINPIVVAHRQDSQDGTIKTAFKLHDGHLVEGVLIPSSTRLTACISSQVGCSMTCAFCATAQLKRERNIDAAEIYDQVVAITRMAQEEHGKGLSNIVYMGMGEPLLNYQNVLDSIDKITSPDGLGMSPKRITVSTVGIAKMIKKLADDDVKFNLALSLHAANDKKRSEIIPINEQNSLDILAEALIYFHNKTGTRVTYEYIIFKDFNDEIEDARELAEFCKHIPCKVNIIEYNPIDNCNLRQANYEKVNAFVKFLESRNIIANIRRSRGKDIDAACGQLANKKG
ncbi:MAG: 23S rRNA (adenine(2503)-C(2))-methyltransferase RlmN [Flavobacteriales bacterium]|nr:23S rRNA (adenine(2503)-C(2))-methyltransferase RlmN [Flavobacteriales bacterium]